MTEVFQTVSQVLNTQPIAASQLVRSMRFVELSAPCERSVKDDLEQSVVSCFEKQVEKYPDHLAIQDKGARSIHTYS